MKNNHDYNREKLKNSACANGAYANTRNSARNHTPRPTTGRGVGARRGGSLLLLAFLLLFASLASLSIGFSKWNIHVQQQLDVSFTYQNSSSLLSCPNCNHYFYASESFKSGNNCPSCGNGKLSAASSTPLLAKYVSLQHSTIDGKINHDPDKANGNIGNVANFSQILSNNSLADSHSYTDTDTPTNLISKDENTSEFFISKDENTSEFFYDSLPYSISISDTTAGATGSSSGAGATGEIASWSNLGISFSYAYYQTHSVVNSASDSNSGYFFQNQSKYIQVKTAVSSDGGNIGVLSAGKYICIVSAQASSGASSSGAVNPEKAVNQLNSFSFSDGGLVFSASNGNGCALAIPFTVYPAEGYLKMTISSDTSSGTENQSLSTATDTPKSANFSASAPSRAISREGSSQSSNSNSNTISVSDEVKIYNDNDNTVCATYNGDNFIIKIVASFNLDYDYLNTVLTKANSEIAFDFPENSFNKANVTDNNNLDNETPYTATAKVVFNENADSFKKGTVNHDFFLPDPFVKYFILKRPVNVTWKDTSFTYDGTAHKPTASTTNFVSGDVSLSVSDEQTNAGIYDATASLSGAKAANYYISSGKTASFTINPRQITVNITEAATGALSSVYGDTPKSLTPVENVNFTATTTAADGNPAIISSDSPSNIFTLNVKDPKGTDVMLSSASNAGEYTVYVSQLSTAVANNYSATFTEGVYTISKRPVSVTISDLSSTYGETTQSASSAIEKVQYTGDASKQGIVNDDQQENIFSVSHSVTNTSDAKTYPITATQLVNTTANNYSVSFFYTNNFTDTDGTNYSCYTVNPATIKKPQITAYTGTYDGTTHKVATITATTANNQTITAHYSKDNGASWLSVETDTVKDAGTFTFTIKLAAPNHDDLELFTSYTFTINAKPVTLTWENFSVLTYTGNSQSPSASFTDVNNATVNATITVTAKEGFSLTNNSAVNAGDYTATASINDSNYTLYNPTQDFTISKAKLTVKADNAKVNMGSKANYTYTITGFVNGENETTAQITGKPKLSSDYNMGDDPNNVSDTYNITVDVSGMSAVNYDFTADDTGTLTVIKASTVAFPYPNDKIFTLNEDVYTVEYTKTLHTLISENDHYTIVGTKEATNVGDYTVTVTPISGYTWSNAPEGYNGTSDAYTFTWKITPKTVTIAWSKDPLTYNGSAQHPTPTFGNVISGDTVTAYSYKFTARAPSSLTDNEPVNAGTYTVKVETLSNDNYILPSDNLSKGFSISKRTLSVNKDVAIERDFTASGIALNTDLLLPANNGNNDIILGICDKDGIANVLSVVFARNCPNITTSDLNAGKFYYKSTNIIHGSTYEIQVVINESYRNNYNFGKNSGADVYADYPILKYKTALVGSTYYTIEDAINNNTGDIILQGGNPYVATCFTGLLYYDSFEYTANQDIILPYADGVTSASAENLSAGNNLVYSVLIIPKGVTLNLNKQLNITAYVAYEDYNRACVTWDRGVVMNHGTINVNDGGSVLAYGYLKGNGEVNLKKGATMTDLMHMYGFGARLALALKNVEFFPVQAYMIHNVSCTTNIYANSLYQVYYLVEAQDKPITGTAPIISNSSDALFQLTSGYVEKYAAKAAAWDEGHASAQALSSIEGSNQIAGQRDVVKLHGATVNDNPLSINIKFLEIRYNISTSYEMPCPISYMDIVVGTGSALTLDSASYKFLAGSSLTVENGATLTTGNKTTLYFFTTQQSTAYTNECYCGAFSPTDNKDAVLIVNGTANIQGAVTGKIESTYAGAMISIVKNNATTVQITGMNTKTSPLLPFEAYYQQSQVLNAIGSIVTENANTAGLLGTESKTLSSNTSYTSVETQSGNKKYAWYATVDYTITYDTNGGTMPSSYVKTGTPGQAIGGLPTPTRDGYHFLHWTYNDEEVTANDVFYYTVTLKAQWEVNTYNLVYDLDKVTATAPTLDNQTVTYGGTYNGKLNEPTNIPDGYTFVGWYTAKTGGSKLENSSTVTATLQNGAELKIYARWKVTLTFNATVGSTFQDGSTQKSVTMDRYSIIINNNEVAALKLNAPDRYLFAGWTNKTLTNYLVEDVDTSGITIINDATAATSPIELYAVWEENKQPVFIKYDYGDKGQSDTETNNAGKLIAHTPPDDKVPEGHYFVSWHTTSACTNDDLVTNYPTPTEGSPGFTEDNPLILYAKWATETYTVILDKVATDATAGTTISFKVTYGGTFTALADNATTPSRTGYRFDGWYTSTEYTTKVTETTSVGDYGANNETVTLVAKWVKTYTITYMSDANVTFNNSATIDEGTTIIIDSETDGMINWDYDVGKAQYFNGWQASNGTTYQPGDSITPTSDMTFTAQWAEKAKVTIQMKSQGNRWNYNEAKCEVSYTPKTGTGSTLCHYKKASMSDWLGAGQETHTFYFHPNQKVTITGQSDSTLDEECNDKTFTAGTETTYTCTSPS